MPKANFGLRDLDVDDSDPFADTSPIDLTAPDFPEQIRALLQREAELDAAGVTCPIKGRWADCNCSACPVRGTPKAQRIRDLCDVGCEQERTVMQSRLAELQA